MDNERYALEIEEERLAEMIGTAAIAKKTGIAPLTLRQNYFSSTGPHDPDKINTMKPTDKGHHKATVEEVERFIKSRRKGKVT